MNLLGIDLGTSSVKAVLITAAGEIKGSGTADYPIRRPWSAAAEQQPDDWWRATVAAVGEALQANGEPIAAIALSGQMHGTVLLDGANRLLGPAIIWPDRRSQQQVKEITQLIGPERLIDITGSPLATGFQAATIRWLQQEQPELWSRVQKVLLPKDYLRWRLTGVFGADPSDGSGTLLLDLRRRKWSSEILAILDLDGEYLPPLQPSDTVAGRLGEIAAESLGLPAGIPVVTGAADTACATLGAGVTGENSLLITISTGGQIVLPLKEVRLDPMGRIHTFCGPLAPDLDQAGYYQMAAILSAGMSLRWLRDRLFNLSGEGAYNQMSAWAENVPPGARGLIFLPYLSGARTPHMDPQARGLFLGLTAGHGRPEMVRAVMEGVALAFFDAYSVLDQLGARPERIVLAGGGARSPLWRQIMADVFNLPVHPLSSGEQSAVGAALLAGAGLGLFDPAETAKAWASYDPPVDPLPGRHAIYRQLLALFRDAYSKHRQDFHYLQTLDAIDRTTNMKKIL